MLEARARLTAWPALPYAQWKTTRDTLHMQLQVIGKVRLALSPLEPQWANVPLYLTGRGLTTSTLETFQIGYAPDSWDALTNYLQGRGYSQQELVDAGLVAERIAEKGSKVGHGW